MATTASLLYDVRMRAWSLALLVISGCTDPTCRLSLARDASHDLVLNGSGACAGQVTLTLRVAMGDPDQPSWSEAAAAPLVVGGSWAPVSGGFARSLTVTNPGAQPIVLVALEWSTRPGEIAADRMLHNGYHSWSYSGMEPIVPSLAEQRGTAPHGGDNEDTLGELPGVSWWWVALSDASGSGLVAGSGGGTVLKSYFAADGTPPRLRILQGATGDSLTLQPGEMRVLDDLFITKGAVADGLEAYAAHVVGAHPSTPKFVLGGWGSWNLYYAMPSASSLRDELAWASANLAPLGLRDFLLDDGYEPHWGDWQASPGFGAALDELNQEQLQAGLNPAVWMAPFYVDVTDDNVAAHPDWFVHRRDGTLRTFNNFGPDYAALDVSHPDARAYAVAALQRYASWGYQTLKIDFLFGGAIEGVRQQPLTGLESYQLWMQTLREAVPNLHLVGCGAPQLPSVGWVDSMRTGADIAYVTSPEPRYGFFAAQARQTAMRAFTDHFWSLDPDVVLLRGSNLDDGEAWSAIVSAAMAGGNYLLGDGRQASAARQMMALAAPLLELVRDGQSARPLDLTAATDDQIQLAPLIDASGDTAVPHLWRKHSWLAVFAWNNDPYRTSIAAGADEILPSGTTMPFSGGSVEVPRHQVRLFRYH
jgi:alpha-galactosidase